MLYTEIDLYSHYTYINQHIHTYIHTYVYAGFFVPPSNSVERGRQQEDQIPFAQVVVDHQNYPINSNAFVEASNIQR